MEIIFSSSTVILFLDTLRKIEIMGNLQGQAQYQDFWNFNFVWGYIYGCAVIQDLAVTSKAVLHKIFCFLSKT